MLRSMLITSALAASSAALAADGDEWPDGPNKEFFQNLQRPDAWHGLSDLDRSCCGPGDIVKTKFRVAAGTGRYPQDLWYAWLKNTWVRIPDHKIVADYAPDGQAYLFVRRGDIGFSDVILCFVRPKGGS